jgi:Mg2+-importing ATPase
MLASFQARQIKMKNTGGTFLKTFWDVPHDDVLRSLKTSPTGLRSSEISSLQAEHGLNVLKPQKKATVVEAVVAQLKNPLIVLLMVSAVLSFFLGDEIDGTLILAITITSTLLGFWQERRASNAVEKLIKKVQTTVNAYRDGTLMQVPMGELVPGDVVALSAGKGVPGDCLLLDSKDLFVNEASLTGETYPIDKQPGIVPTDTPLSKRSNTLFMGTNIVSGEGVAVVVRTGKSTEFGKIYNRLKLRPPENDFERGVRRFGFFLVRFTLVLVVAILVVKIFVLLQGPNSSATLKTDFFDALLFALALAVGMTPDLLPAIVTITMSQGAKKMADVKAIVKKLDSIENFGSMNVLCADKTGTLTEGVVTIKGITDIAGNDSETVLLHAYLNSFFQTGYSNPVDDAIRLFKPVDVANYAKIDEIPYDFLRKRLSILVSRNKNVIMVSKGAVMNILETCITAEVGADKVVEIASARKMILDQLEILGNQGFRVLGVASKQMDGRSSCGKEVLSYCTILPKKVSRKRSGGSHTLV